LERIELEAQDIASRVRALEGLRGAEDPFCQKTPPAVRAGQDRSKSKLRFCFS